MKTLEDLLFPALVVEHMKICKITNPLSLLLWLTEIDNQCEFA